MTGTGRLAAFLRGMNLGGRRLTNDELRSHFEALGLRGVATFLASGNVVFDTPPAADSAATLETTIEAHLHERLGYAVDTFVRSLPALAPLVESDELAAAIDDGFKPHVIFLKEPTDEAAADALAGLEGPDDAFRRVGREVIWLRRGGLSNAPFSHADLERALGGRPNTTRTLNTVRRMLSKFSAAAGS